MKNNRFIPPSDKYSPYCETVCIDDEVLTPISCSEECDQYTYGPFKAPTTLTTYYNYPDNTNTNNRDHCNDGCNYKSQEIVYEIYEIIDGEEQFSGTWIIKNKDTPNLKEFKICGEYILRYCSKPPSECYPECPHPEPPVIIEKNPNCCDSGYIDSGKPESGNTIDNGDGTCTWTPDFEEIKQFGIFLPKCCSITITTSVGDFTLPNTGSSYYWEPPKQFDCPITINSVTGDCSCIDNVNIVVQR